MQPGDVADKCDFQSTPFLTHRSTQPEALTGLAIITPIITAIFYALPGEGWEVRG